MSKRNELRQKKYALILSKTNDPKLAYAGRDWSWSRIESLSVKIPKSVKLTPRQKKLQSTRIKKEKLAIALGFTEQESKTLASKSVVNIRQKALKDLPTQKKVYHGTKDQRKANWNRWAVDKKYPPVFRMEAERINIMFGFDPNASYGWAMVYYSYLEQTDVATQVRRREPIDVSGERYDKIIKGKRLNIR
jgi:hypothetical protein